MPFIRKGLCATDQRKCARLLSQGADPREIASMLNTTSEYVVKFNQKALDANAAKMKKVAALVSKHAEDTRNTAAAIAGAAKTILSQKPEDTGEFE